MKQDRLESYISENREEFEDKSPPDHVWDNITSSLSGQDRRSTFIYWKVAAVVFFVFSLGLLFKNYQTNTLLDSYSSEDNELANTEQYYLKMIKSQEVMLSTYLDEFPALASDFKSDLEELNDNYQNLKKEYNSTGSEEVLGALIQNLQLQQDLLNNQLQIIKKINQENENVSI